MNMRGGLVGVCLLLGASLLLRASSAPRWDREKGFAFLESRQREWAAWKPAQRPDGPCLSCHSGLSYLVARRALGEPAPRPEERALVEAVRARVKVTPPTPTLPDPGAEVVLNLFALSMQRRGVSEPVTAADEAALRHLWDGQIKEGEAAGSWTWVNAALEPWDSEQSTYFGTALVGLALKTYPAQPADRVRAMKTFLSRTAAGQPLHNQLAWVAFTAGLDEDSRRGVLDRVWRAQAPDGGWTTASLGPWSDREDPPADVGSNAYATAWVAYATVTAGTDCADPRLGKALDWLEQRQEPGSGAWRSVSMNKVYRPGSIQEGFMTDAATGYAAAALIACRR